MALHPSDTVSWFLSIPVAQKEYLGVIRHWSTLKIAFDTDVVWVNGFDASQLASVTVQSIPYRKVYYSNGDTLFPQGSLLPERPVPSLLWSPIERGLPVQLPPFRGNYVDNLPPVSVQMIPSETVQETSALLVQLTDLASYIETAPAVRLQAMRWVLLDTSKALLMGSPSLPLPGDALWQRSDFLVPVGYNFDLFGLVDLLNTKLNPDSQHWIIWQQDSTYFRVPKRAVQPLSISSFRISTNG